MNKKIVTTRMKRFFQWLTQGRTKPVPKYLQPQFWKAKKSRLIRIDDENCVWPMPKFRKLMKGQK